MGFPPSIEQLLAEWWGGGCVGSLGFRAAELAGIASNLRFGGNPLYQVTDFLAMYPKFAQQPQGVITVAPNGASPGLGYAVDDVLAIVQAGGSGAQIKVLSLDATAPASYAITSQGTGYQVAAGLATTGGLGVDAEVDITSITAGTGFTPTFVIQTFINLANSSLQFARWDTYWQFAMGLFVAHYCTLWLDSEGNPTSSAGQAAIQGMGKGIAVSKAAGDVSVSYEPQVDESFTTWNLTKYGQQLAALAKVIGMGPMYVW